MMDYSGMARQLMQTPTKVGDVTPFTGGWHGTHYPMKVEDRGGIKVYVPVIPMAPSPALSDYQKYMKALIEQQMKK